MTALESLDLKKALEALLFVTKKPLSIEELSGITDTPLESVNSAINDLIAEYEEKGIRIIAVANGYIFGTNDGCSQFVDKLVNSKIEATLSPQALETLAIITYKQPVTKSEIESIRGLYSDGVLDTLLAKKLIEEKGRGRSVGRPILYGTTIEFLRHFGLKNIKELPNLPQAPTFSSSGQAGPAQEDLFKTVLT